MTSVRERTEQIEPTSRDAIGSWLDVLERMLDLPSDQRQAIRAELEDHLRNRIDDLMITGMSEPEAARAAVGELGETAELARGFRRAARAGKRMTMMHATVIAAMGGLLTLGAATFLGPNTQPVEQPAMPIPPGGEVRAAVLPTDPGEAFDELRRYDVSALVNVNSPLEQGPEAHQLIELLENLAFYNYSVYSDEEDTEDEPMLVVIGTTLFVRGGEGFHKRAAWVLASLHEAVGKQRGLENQRRAEYEREQMRAIEKAEKARQERIEELRSQYDEMRTRFREYQLERMQVLENFKKNRGQAKKQGESDLEMDLGRRFQIESTELDFEQQDIQERLDRIRELLLDAEYGAAKPTVDGFSPNLFGAAADENPLLEYLRSTRGRGSRGGAFAEVPQPLKAAPRVQEIPATPGTGRSR